MLPAAHRLRRSADFTAVMRGGQRAGRSTIVVHLLVTASASSQSEPSRRFGLVVGRSVGNSVVRHRVSRRLRALLAQRIERVAPGSDVVVRARPDAAAATSAELGADLDSALATVTRRAQRAQSGRAQ